MRKAANTATEKKGLPQTFWFGAAFVLLVISVLIGLCVGQFSITVPEILQIVSGGLQDSMERRVFFTLRLPRVLMGLMAGLGLGLTGSIFQTVFKNPLASPDIIGVAAGANMGAAFAIVMLGASTLSMMGGAFFGGILVVICVLALVRVTPSQSTATYVLAGIVMSSLSKAVIMLLKYFADPTNELAAIEYWTMGSLSNITATKVAYVLPMFLLSYIGLLLLRRQIDLMSLNEDECRMLGMPLHQVRLVILVLCTLLVASIISVTGLIAFVGLIAPHIARLMLRRNNFSTTLMSTLIGAIVLLISDTLARCLYTSEIPISILTTLLGVPVLVYFMCKKREEG